MKVVEIIKVKWIYLEISEITFFKNYDYYIMNMGLKFGIDSKQHFQKLVLILKDVIPFENEEYKKKSIIFFRSKN